MKKVLSFALALVLMATMFIGTPTQTCAAEAGSTVPETDLYMEYDDMSLDVSFYVTVLSFSQTQQKVKVNFGGRFYTGTIQHGAKENGYNVATIIVDHTTTATTPALSTFTYATNPKNETFCKITIKYQGTRCDMKKIPMEGVAVLIMGPMVCKTNGDTALVDMEDAVEIIDAEERVSQVGGAYVDVDLESTNEDGVIKFEKEYLYNALVQAENGRENCFYDNKTVVKNGVTYANRMVYAKNLCPKLNIKMRVMCTQTYNGRTYTDPADFVSNVPVIVRLETKNVSGQAINVNVTWCCAESRSTTIKNNNTASFVFVIAPGSVDWENNPYFKNHFSITAESKEMYTEKLNQQFYTVIA